MGLSTPRMMAPFLRADSRREQGGLIMDFSMLERRRDPRTHAFVPITLRYDSDKAATPAHLVDLSSGGAALLTTAGNAPRVGDHIELQFQVPVSQAGEAGGHRREIAVVLHVRRPERGVARVGVRFLQRPEIGSGLFGPRELLSNHRSQLGDKMKLEGDRWEWLRGAEKTYRAPAGVGMN